ncbi:MAG: DUF262 domain-containing protein [Anaerolineaceae bacterium]|nr:DUF262 domain-containing protein [Anaerolineaceae bacterium]MDE0330220.1 DUF262 domain-containing protein [Anaerolineaceae bacterium]
MEAYIVDMAKVFNHGGETHFVLPRFQRAYTWEQKQWQTLWDDLLELRNFSRESRRAEHFLGAMVVIGEQASPLHIKTYIVVDGQQRLLTISSLLCALAQLTQDELLQEQIRSYLVNRFGEGEQRYKVMPTQRYGDRETWQALVEGRVAPEESKSRLARACAYYRRVADKIIMQKHLTAQELFESIIHNLKIVFINLQREERPHQIFESLNAKGVDLTIPELVSNYLAMRLPQAEQDDAYECHWEPITSMLDDRRGNELTAFLQHYLARFTRRNEARSRFYDAFRLRMERDFLDPAAFRGELATLHLHACFYDRLLRPDREPDHSLRDLVNRITILNRTVVYPLMLSLYHAFEQQRLPRAKFIEALKFLENWLARDRLARNETDGLNNLFPAMIDDRRTGDVGHLQRRLLARGYPSNDQLHRGLRYRKIYSRRQNRQFLVYSLLEINRCLPQGVDVTPVLVDDPTVEHIMPQQPGAEWQRELGPDHERVHRDLLNTLGNLTLVTQGYNSRMSNQPWHKKRECLAKHDLPLNKHYPWPERWDEQAIHERTSWLTEKLCQIWPALTPSVPGPDRHPKRNFDYAGSKVASLTIRNKTWEVPRHSWNNLVALFTNKVAIPRPDFEEIAAQLPDELANQRRHDWDRELENGWHLCFMFANRAASYLRELAAICDLADNDWHITLNQ